MNWFAINGDRLFTFITLAAAALSGQPDIPPTWDRWIMLSGILATAAHQSFFPTPPRTTEKP
jgi:hypothetical protein